MYRGAPGCTANRKKTQKINRYTTTAGFYRRTAPENLTGEIKKFQPTHLIIIDAAELNKERTYRDNGTRNNRRNVILHALTALKIIIGYLLESLSLKL